MFALFLGTAAEVNGLEVGDIIVTVNDANVLEASHSEVVKLAHTGIPVLFGNCFQGYQRLFLFLFVPIYVWTHLKARTL